MLGKFETISDSDSDSDSSLDSRSSWEIAQETKLLNEQIQLEENKFAELKTKFVQLLRNNTVEQLFSAVQESFKQIEGGLPAIENSTITHETPSIESTSPVKLLK